MFVSVFSVCCSLCVVLCVLFSVCVLCAFCVVPGVEVYVLHISLLSLCIYMLLRCMCVCAYLVILYCVRMCVWCSVEVVQLNPIPPYMVAYAGIW